MPEQKQQMQENPAQQPPQPLDKEKKKKPSWILWVVLVVILLLIGGGTYYYFFYKEKQDTGNGADQTTPVSTEESTTDDEEENETTDETEDEADEETSDPYEGWETYTTSCRISFKYPASWTVLTEKPEPYEEKMFAYGDDLSCSAVIQNNGNETTIIVLDVCNDGEGGWCYSNGDYTDVSGTRTITTVTPETECSIVKWKEATSGAEWEGDYTECGDDGKLLIYQQGDEEEAREIFDLVVSSIETE